MRLHLRLVGRDHFFPAVLALHRHKTVQISFQKLAYTPSLGEFMDRGQGLVLARK